MSVTIRTCPICNGGPSGTAFPYRTRFNSHSFSYFRCGSCRCVYVDPVPDEQTFERMYSKESYHDRHYSGTESQHYAVSAAVLGRFVSSSARVLDYGCGFGAFLRHLRGAGFVPTGVEFDPKAAGEAEILSNEKVYCISEFEALPAEEVFDVIHFGDVLEHLPDPVSIIERVLYHLRPGGLFFAEGPLEINPSPVFWAATTFGWLKKLLRGFPNRLDPPTHLIRVNARQQKQMFDRLDSNMELLHWEVEETGWPYASGRFPKRLIAITARAMGGRSIMGTTFGNRFRAIYRYRAKSVSGAYN